MSALMEMCNKKKWPQPEFVMVHHSGPDHRKNFLFKVKSHHLNDVKHSNKTRSYIYN